MLWCYSSLNLTGSPHGTRHHVILIFNPIWFSLVSYYTIVNLTGSPHGVGNKIYKRSPPRVLSKTIGINWLLNVFVLKTFSVQFIVEFLPRVLLEDLRVEEALQIAAKKVTEKI